MIDEPRVLGHLEARYGSLQPVRPHVFRASQRLDERLYAVRYFDLSGRLDEAAADLRSYQEDLMAETYFGTDAPADLRWNHYLYFVTADEDLKNPTFRTTKRRLEADRTYARKTVLTEQEVEALGSGSAKAPAAPPLDVVAQWTGQLDELQLSFILDDAISAPEAVRQIRKGTRHLPARAGEIAALSAAERAAGSQFLRSLSISGFRKYPTGRSTAGEPAREFFFGDVNLIVGRNGTGKTSLLEAIEYLYCRGNKRGADLKSNTRIAGELVDSKARLSASVKNPTPAELRGRNAHWYSKIDPLKPTVVDSFGKFNFLDTDAAVNLSRDDDSSDRLSIDVARLILGAEAEKLANKLERVLEKAELESKDADRDASELHRRLNEAQVRLDALRKTPQTSDSLFKSLLDALTRSGWRSPPRVKQTAAEIGGALEASVIAARQLSRSGAELQQASLALLRQRRTKLGGDLVAADQAVRGLKSNLKAIGATRESIEMLQKRQDGLRVLREYVESGLAGKLASLKATRLRIDEETARLAALGDAEQYLSQDPDLVMPLDELNRSVQDETKRRELLVQERTTAVKTIEAVQASVNVLRQRMLAAAIELLTKVSDPDHCPVCRTRFEADQLRLRISQVSEESGGQAPIDAQRQLNEASALLTQARRRQTAIQAMAAFVGADRSPALGQALQLARESRSLLQSERSEMQALQRAITQLAEQGVSESTLSAQLKALDLAAVPSVSQLAELTRACTTALSDHADALKAAEKELKESRRRLSELSGLSTTAPDEAPDNHVKSLTEQLAALDLLVSAIATLDEAINRQVRSDIPLELRLEQGSDQLARLQAALGTEAQAVSTATTEESKIKEIDSALKVTNDERERLSRARALLHKLVGQAKAGVFANEVMRSNAPEISRIFTAIHAPNEFTIRAGDDGGLSIVRDETNTTVTLQQMSTGQRAAYALSLFLAMNCRLRSGPPLILMDDPIAHIDDLNILSFLDHLRELAINGSRQIFLATADDKLAALFRQKFLFLGSDRFKEVSLSRD